MKQHLRFLFTLLLAIVYGGHCLDRRLLHKQILLPFRQTISIVIKIYLTLVQKEVEQLLLL